MCSGGDLDGDLYNVILDKQLVTSATHQPAAYPQVSAMELDRTVTRKDMSDFFVVSSPAPHLNFLILTSGRNSCRRISLECCPTFTYSLPTRGR